MLKKTTNQKSYQNKTLASNALTYNNNWYRALQEEDSRVNDSDMKTGI